MVGHPDAAASALHRALDLAASLHHPFSMAYALHHAALLDVWRRDLAGVGARAEALLAIAEAHGYPTWHALGLVWRGTAAVGAGDPDGGLALVEEGFELYKDLSTPPVFWPALLMLRASALGMGGRPEEGLALIQEAYASLQDGDPMAPDVRIVHGELLLALTPPDASTAEVELDQAAGLAGLRGARMAQLQALTHLANLRRGTPREAGAREALEAVYDGFTEGFDSPHLVAARTALGR
jgi:hypothetical protein